MIRFKIGRYLAVASIILASSMPAKAIEKVTFQLDWLPAGDKAAVYVAKAKGLFAAEGLEVTLQSGRGSSDVVTKLATGTADMGTGGLAALLQAKAESNVPVKAIASIYTVQADSIFTTEGSGINSLKDLVGKKIATATFSSSNVAWPLILQSNGIDPSKVELLKVDPGALAPMLAAGRVDATINWVTVAPGFEGPMTEAKKKLKVISWADHGYEGYGLSVFASEKFLKERPEVARKTLKALIEANKLTMADPKLAGSLLKQLVPEIDADVAVKQFVASIPLMDNAVTKATGVGGFDKALLAKTWEWTAKSQNMALDKLDPETAVDRSFLPK
jgi:NitT/TauT family transport system substrate-binding protein